MLARPYYLHRITTAMGRSAIVALLGPRQVGKTTLARLTITDRQAIYFDLESQPDIRRLQNPELALGALDGIVVIDEIQVMPELFAVLKVLVDRPQNQARFLILGSASPDIVKNVSQTVIQNLPICRKGHLVSGSCFTENRLVAQDLHPLHRRTPRNSR